MPAALSLDKVIGRAWVRPDDLHGKQAENRKESMKYSVVLAVVVLMGCDEGPVEPGEVGPYEVTTLRTLPAGTEASFRDLNENGQALWHEGEQAVLWDNGAILEVPVGEFLGDDGEILGNTGGGAALWRDGDVTTLPGSPMGLLQDGTVYLTRNDTVFTWKDGVLEATDRPAGLLGPEGRIWDNWAEGVEFCGFYHNGARHAVIGAGQCYPIMAEEDGWAIVFTAGQGISGELVVGPSGVGYDIRSGDGSRLDLAHLNGRGDAIASVGIVDGPDLDRIDLRRPFLPAIRLGAINDDGEILAQLADEVVLLTPR